MAQYGTTGNDTINASTEGATIVGYEGDDLLTGSSSGDFILGNQGLDTITGGQGADTLVGGRGEDVLYGNQGADFIFGNESSDVVWGGFGADTLIGGQGADTLYGGEDDDLLYGNEAGDVIDGGDGQDTAAFSGDSSRYVFSRDGAGGVIVTDLLGDGGTDRLTNIEVFAFDNGKFSIDDLIPPPAGPGPDPVPPFVARNLFHFNEALPTSDLSSSGEFSSGAGTPATGFEGVTNQNNSIHLYTSVAYRQMTPPITPVSSTNDGVVLTNHYEIAAGTQSTTNGSPVDNPARAATSDQYDIGTDNGTTLADFITGGGSIVRTYDIDPSSGISAVSLTAVIDPTNHNLDWVQTGTTTSVITDDGGDANTSANSFNRLFIPGFTAASLTPGAQFSDTLSAFDASGHLLASIHNETTLTASA